MLNFPIPRNCLWEIVTFSAYTPWGTWRFWFSGRVRGLEVVEFSTKPLHFLNKIKFLKLPLHSKLLPNEQNGHQSSIDVMRFAKFTYWCGRSKLSNQIKFSYFFTFYFPLYLRVMLSWNVGLVAILQLVDYFVRRYLLHGFILNLF